MSKKSSDILPSWTDFVEKCLAGRAYILVKGLAPDKIFQVTTLEEAKRAVELLTKLKISNWVLFSVEGHPRAIVLMATAMLVKDLEAISGKDPLIYVEDRIAYIDGAFPNMQKADKAEIKKFYEDIRGQ